MSSSPNLILNLNDNIQKKLYNNNNDQRLNKNLFKFKYVIGKGGFGKVWRVQYKKTSQNFALKEMSKRKIIDKKSEKSINSERSFLSRLRHPFIVNMHFAFQDTDSLYLVLDLLVGGDLRYHVSRYRRFSEEQTRFFIACIVFSLKYIHENGVLHRDIKPENLVLDSSGYLRVTDFGIAKENLRDNSSETSGTPGYMSPEVMRGKHHGPPADFFAVGIIGYEFLLGKRPYHGKTRREIKEQIMSKQARIKKEEIRKEWSEEAVEFVNALLIRSPSQRLGSRTGAMDLINHPWLRFYPWKELESKTLPAPFIPDTRDNFDKRYCEGIEKISEETKLRYEEIASSDNFKVVFKNFYYNEESANNSINDSKIINRSNSNIRGICNNNDINNNDNIYNRKSNKKETIGKMRKKSDKENSEKKDNK